MNAGNEKDAVENFDLHSAFSKEVWEVWIRYQQDTTMDPTRFQRVTMQSLLHMAATLSVDLNQPEQVFDLICAACHQAAYQKAAKFS
jgi:cytochrome c